MTRDLTFEERDYADWLLRIEASAIQPLKWIMLAVCLTMWLWAARWTLPPLHVFTLFFLYMMLALVGAFFLRARRIPPAQVKPFVIVSYAVDLLFVTLLILFDITRQWSAGERQSEYYLLYFLVVLRGFAIFRSPRAHLVMSVLISILFVASVALQEHTVRFLAERAFLLRFALIWLVILLAWFIIEILHQQQRETMRVRERLLRSENLARLGEVAAGVAHELNNPLGVISAYSEFLLRAAPPGDERREDFEILHREALRCKTIINQMFLLATPGEIQFVSVRLAPLFEELLSTLRESEESPERATYELLLPPDLPAVRGQPDQLRQAFLNVLQNARQALPPEGGRIRIEADRLTARASAPVRVRVADTGRGIAPADAEKAFEPFFTRREKGVGLGLAITRRIIEAHGGQITLRPADPPPGAIVEILLQADESNSPESGDPAPDGSH